MPSILSFGFFIVRIYKRAVGNPDFEWVNSYELQTSANPVSWEAVEDFLEDVANAEKVLHAPSVEYIRASLSTWNPDPEGPYVPESFVIKEFGAGTVLGTRAVTGDLLARQAVLSVRRQVSFGRSGRLFYRGVLGENDVTTGNSLDWQLIPASKATLDTVLTSFRAAFNSAASTMCGADGRMVMLAQSADFLSLFNREVTALDARGVSVRKADHKYFDRATP